MELIILSAVNWLHLLFTVIWIGGMVLIPLVIMPAAKSRTRMMVSASSSSTLENPSIFSLAGFPSRCASIASASSVTASIRTSPIDLS